MPTIQVDLPQFSFREAALASGVSLTQLRNWIDRKQILLDANTEREDASWRKFSILDVLRIAFVSKLAGFTNIVTASELIEDTIISIAKRLRAFEKPPLGALTVSYDTAKFIAYKIGNDVAIEWTPGESIDYQTIEKICQNSCTFLTLIPGPVVRKIVENLGLDEDDE